MRPSTNGVSKQHPEVCCGLQRQTASPPHPRKLPWIGVHTRCNLVTTWCAAPRESALALLAALLPHSTEYHVVVYLLEAFHAPCVLPARLLTGHISISDHGLRVQMEALILNAAATVCSPRPTGDYRQAALGLVRCNAIRAPLNREPEQHPTGPCLQHHTALTAPQHTSIRSCLRGSLRLGHFRTTKQQATAMPLHLTKMYTNIPSIYTVNNLSPSRC